MRISRPLVSAVVMFIVAMSHANAQQTIRVPARATRTDTAKELQIEDKSNCWLLPTSKRCMGADEDTRAANINKFYGTANKLSYFNQIRSIYNGASSSATVSADITSLNFSNGMQVNAVTNVQAGSSNAASVTAGTVPTLSSASAGQATQNMLYGGTFLGAVLYPLLAIGPDRVVKAQGFGTLIDIVGKGGVDIQNFKSGTSTNVNAPPTHGSVQVEGYLQYNSTNLSPGTSDYAGAVFFGGSYGYSYMSHGYARDYGFGNNVSNGMGQVSAGILISGVAKIAVSRAFGPSQVYIDSVSMKQVSVNNFKAWSFGISYQSPPPK